MIRGLLAIAITGLFTMGTTSSRGAVVYLYTASSEGAGLPGQRVTIPLYLEEEAFEGSSPLLASAGGLASAGVQIVRQQGNATITGVKLDAVDFAGTTSQSALPGDRFSFSESIAPGAPGVLPGNTGGGANPAVHPNEVYLGSIVITLAPAPIAVDSVFDLGALQPFGGHTIDKSGNDLDITNTNPAYTGADTVQGGLPILVIVPEPGSLGALCILATAALPRRRHACGGWTPGGY